MGGNSGWSAGDPGQRASSVLLKTPLRQWDPGILPWLRRGEHVSCPPSIVEAATLTEDRSHFIPAPHRGKLLLKAGWTEVQREKVPSPWARAVAAHLHLPTPLNLSVVSLRSGPHPPDQVPLAEPLTHGPTQLPLMKSCISHEGQVSGWVEMGTVLHGSWLCE